MKNILISLVIVILGLLCAKLFWDNRILKIAQNNYKPKVDTLYVEKYFESEDSYQDVIAPSIVEAYKPKDTPKIVDLEIIGDSIAISTLDSSLDSNIVYLSNDYLLQYPNQNKILQLLLDQDQASLTTINSLGITSTTRYPINLGLYSYNYTPDMGMTSDRISIWKRLKPVVSYTIRPSQNQHDLDFGVKCKISKINYELGLNGFCYPNFNPNMGITWYLRFRYEF